MNRSGSFRASYSY